MTAPAYLTDPYAREAGAVVTGTTRDGLVLDKSIFYPRGGGQPGDTGRLVWAGRGVEVIDTVRGAEDAVVLVPAEAEIHWPPLGTRVTQHLDWERRYAHMRVHTALHLLSVVIPLPVTGGAIAEGRGRLDFLMPDPPQDREALESALADLVARDLPVTEDWITEAELDANPSLVKTMSVAPPRGRGRIRLVHIGKVADPVDLQPCGGTHVATTGEIGAVRIGRIENKGKQNRRVHIALDG